MAARPKDIKKGFDFSSLSFYKPVPVAQWIERQIADTTPCSTRFSPPFRAN